MDNSINDWDRVEGVLRSLLLGETVSGFERAAALAYFKTCRADYDKLRNEVAAMREVVDTAPRTAAIVAENRSLQAQVTRLTDRLQGAKDERRALCLALVTVRTSLNDKIAEVDANLGELIRSLR